MTSGASEVGKLKSLADNHADERPKLLFLAQTLPFPPDGGVQIRTYNIMRLLAGAFDVTALCFYRRATRPSTAQVAASLAGLREIAEAEAFPIPQEHSRARLLFDHARSAAARRVYTCYAYESSPFRARLEQLLAGRRFDLVHMDSLDLSAYLPLLEGLPIICTHHNVESDLLRRRAGSSSPGARLYLELQAGLMRAEERHWCSEVDLNVVVSNGDAARLRELVPGARVEVVPNGVDTTFFRPGLGVEQEGVAFVGGYSWYPNRDAMEYFVRDILPLVNRDGAAVPVTWIGRSPAIKEEFERAGVRVTGYVEDIRPYVQQAACYIAPLRVGGGTRLKILDAWAMGKAVVSTSVGCEGLAAVDGENILIRDDPAAFAAAILEVLGDTQLREQLGRNARRTVEERYSWEGIGLPMLRTYLQLASASPGTYPAFKRPGRG